MKILIPPRNLWYELLTRKSLDNKRKGGSVRSLSINLTVDFKHPLSSFFLGGGGGEVKHNVLNTETLFFCIKRE